MAGLSVVAQVNADWRYRVITLAGDPSAGGELVMIIQRYGDRGGWRIEPSAAA